MFLIILLYKKNRSGLERFNSLRKIRVLFFDFFLYSHGVKIGDLELEFFDLASQVLDLLGNANIILGDGAAKVADLFIHVVDTVAKHRLVGFNHGAQGVNTRIDVEHIA